MVQKRLTGEKKDKVVIRKENVCTELSSRAAGIEYEDENTRRGISFFEPFVNQAFSQG